MAENVKERCRCDGTGIVTMVTSLAGAVLLSTLPCPARCAIPGTDGTVDAMAALLDAEERRLVAAGGGFVGCGSCQDFRTDVTGGVEHPCEDCQPDAYRAWRAGQKVAP